MIFAILSYGGEDLDSIEILEKLIQYDGSTKVGANESLLFCESYLKSFGIKSNIIENNGYKSLVCETGKGYRTLILNGHLDIVGGKEGQFTPYIKNDKVYGRGSADMKAAVAAMLCTFIYICRMRLFCKVQLHLVTDEEIGGTNCTKNLLELGYRGDFVICGEPTNLDIGIQSKGILQISIDLFYKSAHGSRQWEGENAIIKAYELYSKILDLPFMKEKSKFYSGPSINLAKIEGGEVYNKVPNRCCIYLDIRFLPDQKKEDILQQITDIAENHVNVHSFGNPVNTGFEVGYFGQHGSADNRYYSEYDIPSI